MHTTGTIFILVCIMAIINQAYLHPRHHKAPTDWQTIGTRCQQDNPRIRKNSPKGHTKALQSFTSYNSLFASHFDAITLVNKSWHSTWMTHKFFSKLIIVNKRWKKPPPLLNNNSPNIMSTHQQTVRARLQSEKKTAEAALKLQMEKAQLKRLEDEKQRDAERKQEEELRTKAEAEQRKLQVLTIAETMVVSPPTQMEEDRADPSINSHLLDMMQGGSKEDASEDKGEQCSSVKSKPKKITFGRNFHCCTGCLVCFLCNFAMVRLRPVPDDPKIPIDRDKTLMKTTKSIPLFKTLLPASLLCCAFVTVSSEAAVLMKPTAATTLNYPHALTPEKVNPAITPPEKVLGFPVGQRTATPEQINELIKLWAKESEFVDVALWVFLFHLISSLHSI